MDPTADPCPSDFAPVLLRACTEENVIASYHAIMVAVHRREQLGETPSLAGISIECGYSYNAVRNMVSRTHYLEKVDATPVGLRLTTDGIEKLARISKRLTRYTTA